MQRRRPGFAEKNWRATGYHPAAKAPDPTALVVVTAVVVTVAARRCTAVAFWLRLVFPPLPAAEVHHLCATSADAPYKGADRKHYALH
ncbi:hypothetical protein D3C78_1552930 [compost metagenome]